MKANTTNILLIVLIVILAWQNFFSDKEIKAPTPITVNIPEIKGTSGERVIERIVTQPVYIKESGETISVDSEWKRKYEEAKDSMEKHKQYIKAIKINKYEIFNTTVLETLYFGIFHRNHFFFLRTRSTFNRTYGVLSNLFLRRS